MSTTFITESLPNASLEDLKSLCPLAELNYLCLLRELSYMKPEEILREDRIHYGVRFEREDGEYMARDEDYCVVLNKRGSIKPEGYDYGDYTQMILWSSDPDDIGKIMTSLGFLADYHEEVTEFVDGKLTKTPLFAYMSERKMGHVTQFKYLKALTTTGTYTWRSIINYCAGRVQHADEKIEILWNELKVRGIDGTQNDAHGVLYEQLLAEVHEKLREVGMIP